MRKKETTRREFLSMAAMSAAAAGFAASGFDWARIEALGQGLKVKDNYPVVVVGSGLGGLSCAAYLAKAGFPVTVLERRSTPGGYATAFQRGKYDFEVSLHATSVNNNSSYDNYRDLGLLGKIKLVRLVNSHRTIVENTDIILPFGNPAEYIDILSKNFPHEKNGIKSFVGEIIGISNEVNDLSRKKGKYAKVAFPVQYKRMWKVRNQSLSQLLNDHVRDAKVRSILSDRCGYFGLPPSRLSGFFYAAGTGDFIKNGPYTVQSRSRDLSNALVDIIKGNGGKVFFSSPAKKIIVKDGRVAGVQADGGTMHPARIVVSNSSLPETFQKLVTGCDCSSYIQKISRYLPSISAFQVFIGLKGELRGKIPGCNISMHPGTDWDRNFIHYQRCDAENAGFETVLFDNFYKGYSRPGTSTVSMIMLSGYEPWRRFEKDYFAGNKKEYQIEKKRVADILIKRAEKALIPDLRSMIDIIEVSTPLTNIRYTGNPGGAIYGYEQTLGNSFMNRIQNSTPVKGLYLASAWGNPGGGYGGVMNAGASTFYMIMEDIK